MWLYNCSRKIFILWLIIFITNAYAWDSTGHRIMAWIAYQHLQPAAKQTIDQLTEVLDKGYSPLQRFLYTAVLPDRLRVNNIKINNSWHYINYPYGPERANAKAIDSENLLWAINRSETVIKNPNSGLRQKAIMLSFLIHFVGDAHQPMHCINYFSSQFPRGDQGGNFYAIKAKKISNLHSLWDQGVELYNERGRNHSLSNKKVIELAEKIEYQFPPSYFHNAIGDLNAANWTKESFTIAKQFAYNIQENSKPSKRYIQQGKVISSQQLALAGYRLAHLLNNLSFETNNLKS